MVDPKLIEFIKEYGHQFIPKCYSQAIFIDMLRDGVADFVIDKMMAVAVTEQCDDARDIILNTFNPVENAIDTFYNTGYYQPEFLKVLVEKGWRVQPRVVCPSLECYSKPAANAVSESLTGWCVM